MSKVGHFVWNFLISYDKDKPTGRNLFHASEHLYAVLPNVQGCGTSWMFEMNLLEIKRMF